MGTPSLQHVTADESTDALLEALDEDGAVIVDDALSHAQIDAILSEVGPHIDRANVGMAHLNPALDDFYRNVRNVTGLVAKSPTVVDAVLLNPVLTRVADAVLLANCADYQLNVAHLLGRESDAPQQFLHRDEEVWVHLPRPRPDVQVASITALTDFRADNGATVVAPGSHRWPHDRYPTEDEVTVAEMDAGSMLIYRGTTYHGGGHNRTGATRLGIHLSLMLGWLRPEENNILSTPPDVARTLPRRAQELVGYSVHDAIADAGGYLGAVELRNPIDLLAERAL